MGATGGRNGRIPCPFDVTPSVCLRERESRERQLIVGGGEGNGRERQWLLEVVGQGNERE
jgi:hypothetical protein